MTSVALRYGEDRPTKTEVVRLREKNPGLSICASVSSGARGRVPHRIVVRIKHLDHRDVKCVEVLSGPVLFAPCSIHNKTAEPRRAMSTRNLDELFARKSVAMVSGLLGVHRRRLVWSNWNNSGGEAMQPEPPHLTARSDGTPPGFHV